MHLAGHLRQALVLLAAFTAIVVRRRCVASSIKRASSEAGSLICRFRFADKVVASFFSNASPLTPAAWTFQIDLPLSFAMGLLSVFQVLSPACARETFAYGGEGFS